MGTVWYDHRADGTLHAHFSVTGSSGPVAEMDPQIVSQWTDVAALRERSYGMRIVVHSRCDLPDLSDLPDLPLSLPFSLVGSTIRSETRSLLCASTARDRGRHWPSRRHLEAICPSLKSPRVRPNLPPRAPSLHHAPYPTQFAANFPLISVSSS